MPDERFCSNQAVFPSFLVGTTVMLLSLLFHLADQSASCGGSFVPIAGQERPNRSWFNSYTYQKANRWPKKNISHRYHQWIKTVWLLCGVYLVRFVLNFFHQKTAKSLFSLSNIASRSNLNRRPYFTNIYLNLTNPDPKCVSGIWYLTKKFDSPISGPILPPARYFKSMKPSSLLSNLSCSDCRFRTANETLN